MDRLVFDDMVNLESLANARVRFWTSDKRVRKTVLCWNHDYNKI